MKKLIFFILAFILAASLCLFAGEPLMAQGTQGPQETAGIQTINIKGKILKEADDYYIQGKSPSEVFRILNPIPKRLDRLASTNKLVRIEAGIVMGDNVNILNINGKAY